ncbi:MAG: MBL fold metallo-hydrolase [Scytonema sp. RU_4_4]|nr:MBL fold metallo-hydrolase [Scytonema sp. RU_4_4]
MSDRLSVSSRVDMEETASELECLPFGVHHDDEGVCLLVRMGPHRILLDCGLADVSPLVKGLKKSARRGSSPLPADFVLVSHAHRDHARGLLALHKAFPLLPIYASEVTSKLLPLNWLEQDHQEVPSFCQALPLRSPVEFKDGLVAEIFPAGHLPGSVAILLTYTTQQRSYKLLYTGDFFLSNSRLVEGLRLEELRGIKLDVLIIEGSYGTSRHPHRRTQENQLAERINRAIAERCSVLLPTPTLGLGQELLMLLRSHHHFTGRDLDIWVDGTVAVGCDAYLELLPHLPPSVQNFARHQPLFWDERIRPRVRRMQPEQLLDVNNPCIILTDSTADLYKYCQSTTGSWLTLFPEKTNIKINDEYLQVMTVETYLLAQHSDGPGTTQLIHNLRPQHVIFVHGSPTYLADLTSLEELQNRYHLHSPAAGTLVELPIGETFLQPAAPEANYEGELTELGTVVTITLPDAITADPRWRQFADTGLIEARWQGEDLVLRGLSQRELLNQNSDRFTGSDLDCCGTCRHQRGQRCWNPASPLYNFKVTLDGYCPAFERNTEKSSES